MNRLPRPRRAARWTRSPGRIRLGAATLAAGLIALSAAAGVAPHARADQPTTLTESVDQISTFNPFISYFDSELYVIGSIYPSLDVVQVDGSVKPYLADSWTTSADKLTWTFKIHQGLKWSDGQPITAGDAAWTFNTIRTNKVAGTANGSLLSNWTSVTAPDDATLVIKTAKPQSNMLNLSVPFTGIQILPEHIWKSKVSGDLKSFKNDPSPGTPVVGYGPFSLTDYKTDQYTTITANKSFFLGAPKFDRMVFQYFKSSDAAVQALQGGEIDELGGVTATQFEALKKQQGLTAYQLQATHWAGLEINPGAIDKNGNPLKTNTGDPALKDQTVRNAIAYGIDRNTLVKKVLNGLGTPGAAYLPPAYPQWKWAPSASETFGYDPAKANQILDAAGYTKGSDGIRTDPKTHKKLAFRLGTHSDDSNDAAIAGYLVSWMKDIGITVTIQPQSFSALNDNLAKGDWDLLMDGWSTGLDPTYLLSIQTCGVLPDTDGSGGNTDAFFCDKAYDQLFAQQQTEFDTTQRAATIAKMQAILYKANVDIMLYNDNGRTVVNTGKVQNYITGTPDANGAMPLQNGFSQLLNAAPVTERATGGMGSQSSSNAGPIIGGIVAVVVVAGVITFIVLRRRATAGERE